MKTIKFRRLKKYLLAPFVVIKKMKNWPVYFLDCFKLIRKKYIIYYFRNGQKIKVRAASKDCSIIYEIFICKRYNPKGFEIKGGDVVVDIGAHIGVFSIFASKLASKVYSLEPMDDNFAILQDQIEINKAKNIYPFKSAVLDITGEKELFVSSTSIDHSFYINENASKKALVPTISLEDLVASNNISKIDFLKMDCEGAEYDIILNCPKKILDIIEKISMECHDIDLNRNARMLLKFLERNGFTFTKNLAISPGCSYIFAKK